MAAETHLSKTPAGAMTQAEQTRGEPRYRPDVDILETEEELLILADVPGATAEGIDLDFNEGELTIHAKTPSRHEDVQYLHCEYGIGDYYRTFRVSEAVDASKITAELADGVLTLHLPKSEASKPRKIPVKE